MGPVPNKDMQIPKSQNPPPQPSEVIIYMKDAHSAESNYISDFFFIYGWLHLQFTATHQVGVSLTKKKSCSNVAEFIGKMRIDLTMIF